MNPVRDRKHYWFRAKNYGWGWTPITWQGWGIIAAWVVFNVVNFIYIDSASHSGSDTLINFIPQLVLSAFLLVFVAWRTGEKPRWRWAGHDAHPGHVFIQTVWLSAFIITTELVGGLGALATAGSVTGWYAGLIKPTFNPPTWVFAPAWTLLYALMGSAAYIIWSKRKEDARANNALGWYGIHLLLNGAWSFLFFGLHNPGIALIEIVILWWAICFVAIKFWHISRWAGVLFIPYILWVTFAFVLNFSIWRLN